MVLGYAVFTANVFLGVVSVVALVLTTFVLYLFYRLVVAVEDIAHKM
ncbi:hypothetical protein [Halobiforma nitratireducens]|nr:hypothetical protein [Halobiforma nitratireducens]